jgi:hypothetical protein
LGQGVGAVVGHGGAWGIGGESPTVQHWLAGMFHGGVWAWAISCWFLSLAVVSILKMKKLYLISCFKHETNEKKKLTWGPNNIVVTMLLY